MSEPRVIRADYANWRPVAGRKVLQLVFEVPIEQTEQVLKMLGVPMPGESKWCAIALLENNGSASESAGTPPRATPRPSSGTVAPDALHGGTLSPTTVSTAETGTSEIPRGKDRRPFSELEPVQQAAIRCTDNQFWNWLGVHSEDEAAEKVRVHCGVGSRKEIRRGSRAAALWSGLEAKYKAWLTDEMYAEARR